MVSEDKHNIPVGLLAAASSCVAHLLAVASSSSYVAHLLGAVTSSSAEDTQSTRTVLAGNVKLLLALASASAVTVGEEQAHQLLALSSESKVQIEDIHTLDSHFLHDVGGVKKT